jgi:hypothetical protein
MEQYYVRSYRGTCNVGDAVQTYALCRLLPGKAYCWDHVASDKLVVFNGWLGRPPLPVNPNTVFAGIHLTSRHVEHLRWCGSGRYQPVGCRDPWTQRYVKRAGLAAEYIGCATLTLPRYRGPRSGELHIDDGTPGCRSNWIDASASWPEQWNAARDLLHSLRSASVVYTGRLHVVLPCLAFGTPVCWFMSGDEAEARFSILAELGLPQRTVIDRFDVEPLAARFKSYLEGQLGRKIAGHDEPGMPASGGPA